MQTRSNRSPELSKGRLAIAGGEFAVRVPAASSGCQAAPAADGANPAVLPPVRHRVLVADDNEDAANSLAMMIEYMGHDVRAVHDGAKAVAVAESFRPDFILLDIGMPRTDGYEACRRIREQAWARHAMIIAVTGWGQDEDKRRSAQAGFDLHLVKPVEPETLEKLLTSPPANRRD